jgi:hypothetical protein
MNPNPNPNLRGSLAVRGATSAVLIHVDPHAARIKTDTFLIGTRRTEELISALRESTGHEPGPSAAWSAPHQHAELPATS